MVKIAAFGCWNIGCIDGSGQKKVSELIKTNEKDYEFMIILGDNYYPKKNKDKDKDKDKTKDKKKDKVKEDKCSDLTLTDVINKEGFKCPPKPLINEGDKNCKTKDKTKDKKPPDINIKDMEDGFKCLADINLQKKLIMGNHDINDGITQDCVNLRYQLNDLPKYNKEKLPYGYDIKFPYGYDKYDTLLILYIDTTIYAPEYGLEKSSDIKVNDCYEKLKYKNIMKDRHNFIIDVLNFYKGIIKHVLICGHEPLLTYKIKCDIGENADEAGERDKSAIIKPLIDLIFEQKTIYKDIPFTYLCADYHIYQYSKIYKDSDYIDQIIVGTGGGSLDDLTPYTRPKEYFLDCYTLKIEKNNVKNDYYNTKVCNCNTKVCDCNTKVCDCICNLHSHGINHFGYVEIDYNTETYELIHNFIPIEDCNYFKNKQVKDNLFMGEENKDDLFMGEQNKDDLFKNKYFKYKSKYLKLKKNNYLFTK